MQGLRVQIQLRLAPTLDDWGENLLQRAADGGIPWALCKSLPPYSLLPWYFGV